MSDDRLAQLHEALKEPLRQKILLKFGLHDALTFEGLMHDLKIQDVQELSNQLNVLENLTVDGEHLLSKQTISEKSGEQYALTDKGHEVLDDIIAFPQLKFDESEKRFNKSDSPVNQQKPKPKWFTPYWFALFAADIVVLAIVFPVFGHQPLDKAALYTVASLMILGLGYYARVKPSITLNKLVYIGLVGFLIGCVFWFIGLIIAIISLSHDDATQNTAFVVLTTISFTLGPIVGYLIGKARNFKGPAQYSP